MSTLCIRMAGETALEAFWAPGKFSKLPSSSPAPAWWFSMASSPVCRLATTAGGMPPKKRLPSASSVSSSAVGLSSELKLRSAPAAAPSAQQLSI